MQLIQEKGN